MGPGTSGKGSRGAKTRVFSDKAYRRAALAPWDEKWHGLSVAARKAFLAEVKGPSREPLPRSQQPSVSSERFAAEVLRELVEAGFVAVEDGRKPSSGRRVYAEEAVLDFATRLRAVERYNVLKAKGAGILKRYVSYTNYNDLLVPILGRVARQHVEVQDYLCLDDFLVEYVNTPRWPEWVASFLEGPVFEKVLEAVREADGPVSIVALTERVEGFPRDQVRAAIDGLVTHLALAEDLAPDTFEILVGFFPQVRAAIDRALHPPERPPLVRGEPVELGPEGSVHINDLRAILLEALNDRPRLRQNMDLYQRDAERMRGQLEPVPAWFQQTLMSEEQERVNRALDTAVWLGLAREVDEDGHFWLTVTPEGSRWLAAELDEQYRSVFERFNSNPDPKSTIASTAEWLDHSMDVLGGFGTGDADFLGVQIAVLQVREKGRRPYYWEARPADHEAFRKAIEASLSDLEPGVFYRAESVMKHATVGDHNPVNLGLPPEQVMVYVATEPVPPQEDLRNKVGRGFMEVFTRSRLIPMGCFRTAIDESGVVLLARQPLFDAYFGRAAVTSGLSAAAKETGRVVVQPDFSVIVIGLSTAPVAALAPFCERPSVGGSPGAKILKITRESVVKAASQGLKPDEIIARLERLAGKTIPPNVLREIREWGNWVRRVTATTLSVLRCPDRETADRVMGVLRKSAERLGDTLVAVDPKVLTESEYARLRAQGVLVDKTVRSEPKKKKKSGRR
ncbi:MAG: helicase-associated domain-containing protein [Isosphaeraceae bacterium]